MVKETELYKTLGIDSNATEKEIKKAYRGLALQYHPDKPTGDEEKFKEISAAYDVLSNAEKRQKYDQYGKAGLGEGGMGMNPNDIFQHIFGMGGMGGMGGNPFGQRKRMSAKPIQHTEQVNLNDIYTGKKINIKYMRDDVCSKCDGKGSNNGKSYKCNTCKGQGVRLVTRQIGPGMIQQMQARCDDCNGCGENIDPIDRCKQCSGKKLEKIEHTYCFDMPPGTPENVNLGVQGEGNQCSETFQRSDLVLKIVIKKDPLFVIEENDLVMTMQIDLWEALCGFTKQFKHINEQSLWFKIDHMTQIKDGDVRIVQGKGMPIFRTKKFGNLIVKFKVNYPPPQYIKENSHKIKKLLKTRHVENIEINDKCKKIELMSADKYNAKSNDNQYMQSNNESDDEEEHQQQQQCQTQ